MKKLISILAILSMLFCSAVSNLSFAQNNMTSKKKSKDNKSAIVTYVSAALMTLSLGCLAFVKYAKGTSNNDPNMMNNMPIDTDNNYVVESNATNSTTTDNLNMLNITAANELNMNNNVTSNNLNLTNNTMSNDFNSDNNIVDNEINFTNSTTLNDPNITNNTTNKNLSVIIGSSITDGKNPVSFKKQVSNTVESVWNNTKNTWCKCIGWGCEKNSTTTNNFYMSNTSNNSFVPLDFNQNSKTSLTVGISVGTPILICLAWYFRDFLCCCFNNAGTHSGELVSGSGSGNDENQNIGQDNKENNNLNNMPNEQNIKSSENFQDKVNLYNSGDALNVNRDPNVAANWVQVKRK